MTFAYARVHAAERQDVEALALMATDIALPFLGGCACGAVRYECTAPPLRMVNCHCRDCQVASGSGYAATLIMEASAVRLMQGAPKRYSRTAASGNVAHRSFCESCGTPLFASSSAAPQFLGVKAASLDDPRWFRPSADVWVASAQPWDSMAPEVPSFQAVARESSSVSDVAAHSDPTGSGP
jgi:hypothetical protein